MGTIKETLLGRRIAIETMNVNFNCTYLTTYTKYFGLGRNEAK